MATIHDAAAGVLDRFDRPVSTRKMQSLVYLAQGWKLGLRQETMFDEPFTAWSLGPTSLDLFRHHRREYSLSSWPQGATWNLDAIDRIVLDAVVSNYGALAGGELSDLKAVTGEPWQRARARSGAPRDQVATEEVIPIDEIQAHFQMLLHPEPARSRR